MTQQIDERTAIELAEDYLCEDFHERYYAYKVIDKSFDLITGRVTLVVETTPSKADYPDENRLSHTVSCSFEFDEDDREWYVDDDSIKTDRQLFCQNSRKRHTSLINN
jgi:hypothetical protein